MGTVCVVMAIIFHLVKMNAFPPPLPTPKKEKKEKAKFFLSIFMKDHCS